MNKFPVTPDGRYFVVRGRLWRCSNPALPAEDRATLVRELMDARRALQRRMGLGSDERLAARRRVDAAKVALGERGPVWWDDGTPDFNRRMAVNSPYRNWFLQLFSAPGPGEDGSLKDMQTAPAR